MSGNKVTAALASVLMTSVALAAPALAQSGGLAGSAGVVVLSLPGVDTGVVSNTAVSAPGSVESLGLGVSFGVDGRLDLGPVGDHNGFIGFSGYGVLARGTSSNATTLSGSGALIVPGYTTPSDFTMDLNTASAAGNANAESDLNQTALAEQNDVDAVGVAGAGYAWGVNPGNAATVNDPSFLYGGVFVDGAGDGRAAAFGAVADEDGNILIAVGDLTGVVVTTDVTQNVAMFGGDVTFGLSGVGDGGVVLSGFAGPSYRFLRRDIDSSVTVDFPELGTAIAPFVGTEFPFYRLSRDEQINTHYMGGVIGGSASTAVSDTMILNLGVKGGIYAASTSASGTETASVFGGSPAPATDPTAVTNLNTLSLTDNGLAFSFAGSASVTMPMSESTQLTLGGGGEYLSRVATLDHVATATVDTSSYGAGDDDGQVLYSAQESLQPVLSFGSMWSFNVYATFSGQF